MATSGSYSANVVTNVNLVLEWQQKSQSVANNTSTISWTLKLVSSGGSILSNKSQSYKVGIGGTTKSGTTSLYITSGSKTIASGTVTVNHNGNGTFTGNSYFTCSYGDIVSGNNKTIQGSGSITPNAINRGAYFTSAPNFTDEDNPKIQYSNPSGSNTTAIRIAINKASGNTTSVIGYRSLTVYSSGAYTFNFTDAERKALQDYIPDQQSTTVYFTLESTVGGYKFYQSSGKTLTITNAAPIVAPQLVASTSHKSYPLIGNTNTVIRGYNDYSFYFNSQAQKGSTIVERNYEVGGVTSTPLADGFSHSNVRNPEITFNIVDSRNYATAGTYTINMIPYVDLTCTLEGRMTINAANSAQTDLELTISGNYYNGSFGVQNNELTLKYNVVTMAVGSSSGSGVTKTVTIPEGAISGNSYSVTIKLENLSQEKIYVVQATAADKITALKGTTVTSATQRFKITPIFDWGENDFKINVPLYLEGNSLNDYVIESGTEAMGTNGTWYWRKWNSGKADCYGLRNFGNMAITTAWGALYVSPAFTQPYPTGLFISAPEGLFIDINKNSDLYGTSGCWLTRWSNNPTNTETSFFKVVSPVSGNRSSVHISFYAIGRWK